MEVGFFGLGAMGMPMARNLLERGVPVIAWDLREEARDAFQGAGGTIESPEAALGRPVLMLSLPHSDIVVKFAHETLLPHCKPGQIIADFTTVIPEDARKLAAAFNEKGAIYLDCPVSGGPSGVERRLLRIFAGGDRGAFDKIRSLLDATTSPEEVFYCGESGHGQIIKGVNQLAMGLLQAAGLEAVWYGVAAGVPTEIISAAVGGDDGFRGMIRGICNHAEAGRLEKLSIKYDQYGFFLNEAATKGFPLPLVHLLNELLADRPKVLKDANQLSPSYWSYLKDVAANDAPAG